MERTFTKLFKGISKIMLFFGLWSECFSQSLDIIEKIEGKNLSRKKTPIFFIRPSISEEINLYDKFPEIKLEEKFIEKEEPISKQNEQMRNLHFYIKFGSFLTNEFELNYKDKNFNLGMSNFYTKNYRENSEIEDLKFNFSIFDKENSFNFNFKTGKIELPGPIKKPFINIERDFLALNWNLTYLPFENLSFYLGHRYYNIEKEDTNFFDIFMDKNFGNFKLITGFEEQIFKDKIFSFSNYICFEKEKLLIKPGLKFIEKEGVKFLLDSFYKFNDNFSIFLDSEYKTPDFWEELILNNWKEIKKENLKPILFYKAGMKINISKIDFEISHSYNRKYLWFDNDSNFLYEPYIEKFWQTSLFLNSKIPIRDNFNLLLDLKKNIFYKDIFFLPKNSFKFGFEYKNDNFSFELFDLYTGERRFPEEKINDFNTLNFEIIYKKKFEIGLGIYNLLNKKYEIVQDYIGEKRKFLIWLKF